MGMSLNVNTINTKRDFIRTALRYKLNCFKHFKNEPLNKNEKKRRDAELKEDRILIRRVYNRVKHVIRNQKDSKELYDCLKLFKKSLIKGNHENPLMACFGGGELLNRLKKVCNV